ncbi:MAG: hypothetical protein ACLRWH_08490 [Emergencia sp.]
MYVLKEALALPEILQTFPQMLPSLNAHHAEDPLYNEGEYPLATGERKGYYPMFLLCQSSLAGGKGGTAGESAEEIKKRGRER